MSNALDPQSRLSSLSAVETRGGIADTGLPARVKGWASALTLGRNMDAGKAGSTTERWARSLVHGHMGKMQRGQLTLVEGNDSIQFGDTSATEKQSAIVAEIHVQSPAAFSAIAFNGVVGAAEAYMDGLWTTPDLLSVIRFFVSNIVALKGMDKERSAANAVALKLLSMVTRNSVSGSRKNISAHYDLGNDFFELFLDPSMMYSAAVFNGQNLSLEEAAIAKLETMCRKLQLNADDHLVEIGTGWGGMAVYAAKNYGCRVTTTTLSQQQHDFTRALVEKNGLEDKITVVMKDYRELHGQFDKLVSIEMIEAVGHQYFSDYFNKCSSLLKPDGLMSLQAITIADQRYDQARRSVDFIQRYIFPGGCLPSMSVIARHVAEDTDMGIVSVNDITQDYAKTLGFWRKSFEGNLDKVRALGFDERFIRMWLYYLCYCQGGFQERVINTVQMVIAKPDYRPN